MDKLIFLIRDLVHHVAVLVKGYMTISLIHICKRMERIYYQHPKPSHFTDLAVTERLCHGLKRQSGFTWHYSQGGEFGASLSLSCRFYGK